MTKQKVINGVTVTLFKTFEELKAQNFKEAEVNNEGFNIYTNFGAHIYGLFDLKILSIYCQGSKNMDFVIKQAVDKMFPESENKEQIKAEILEFIG
jgi:hypothetical protein